MIETIPENSIIVVKDSIKKDFIKEYRKLGLKNDSIIGLNEFKKKYYFDYSIETINYIIHNYSCIKEIAKIYLENLYYVKEDSKYEKVKFLNSLKKDLEDHHLLIKNPLFRSYLKTKTVVLYDLEYIDKFYHKMFDEIRGLTKIIKIEPELGNSEPKNLYSFLEYDAEIEYVASHIAELIKNGVSIDNIKIANPGKNYLPKMQIVFKDFHIPVDLPCDETLSSTKLFSQFKKLFATKKLDSIDELKEFIHSKKDEQIVNKIVGILNSYVVSANIDDAYSLILNDIATAPVPKIEIENCIKVINLLDYFPKKEDYIFLMNFNQGSFPAIKKDEDFLNDEIKISLGISDSVETNKNTFASAVAKIKNIEHLVVTYSKRSDKGELYISPIYNESILKECTPERSFKHSDDHNLKELLREKDENLKYGTSSNALLELDNHYKDYPFMSYDNSFKGLPKEKLATYLADKLTLSYSSMNTYYQCGFRYYLDNILKMDEFDNTFDTVVGNVFHRVLSFAFKEDFDFESSWGKALEESEYEFDNKEKFFLSILKKELIFIIDGIKKGMEYTDLRDALYEQKITVDIDEHTTFKGFVDKILYGDFDGQKVAIIIDYKTGMPELKLDNAYYGLDMQLPVYAYLLGHYEPLKDAKIGGFYLQKILSTKKTPQDKLDALKLQGYSTSNIEILSHVDKNFKDSKIIKSLRMGQNGFYAYSKTLSDERIAKLISLVESKIREAAKKIEDADFAIDPKQIGINEIGCKFCKYKDICYKNAKDIKKLPYVEANKFLGGEQDADMD